MSPVFCCVQCPVADASSVPLAWLAMSIASTTAAPTSHSPACDPDFGTRGGGGSAWDRRTLSLTCSEKHMYLEAHMQQLTITHTRTHTHSCMVGADELERLDVTGLIMEECPFKPPHTRA